MSSDFCYTRVRVSKDDLRVPQVMVEAPRTLGDRESTPRQVVAEEINVRRNLKTYFYCYGKICDLCTAQDQDHCMYFLRISYASCRALT